MAGSDTDPATVARQEAVQPSLWDRLVDDLPGLAAEAAALTNELARELKVDAADVDELIEGGVRAIERRSDLDEDLRRRALKLLRVRQRERHLRDAGVMVTADVLREAVRRDIEMLFNIERFEARYVLTDREAARVEATADLLADYPEVRASVLNYGGPSFSGRRSSDFDRDALARDIKEALVVFEPRLKKETIRVKIDIGDKTGLKIGIDGVLMLSPVPERLRLSTTIDLDSGQARCALEEV